jgi:hypothetical protein
MGKGADRQALELDDAGALASGAGSMPGTRFLAQVQACAVDAGRELEFCRGVARMRLLSSYTALPPVVSWQYRLSPRAPM